MGNTNEYAHLKDKLVTNDKTLWNFNQVRNCANKYNLELTDEDFRRFIKLQAANKDIDWIMHKMSKYKTSFIDTLISYLTF